MGTLRILHTADWHLGHALAGHSREAEHQAFLSWTVELAREQEVDAICVAGDVFDGRSPSGAAQALYFGWLAELRQRLPDVPVVVIAGNHDSPSRLAAAGPVLGMLGVRVVGAAAPERPPSELAMRLDTRRGALAVAAVPHVRPSDLRGVGDGLDPERNRAALRRLFGEVADEARALAPGAPLVVLGHAHVQGAVLSPRSERSLFGFGRASTAPGERGSTLDAGALDAGALNAGALDAGAIDLGTFPDDAAYVALGHLHLAQTVSGRTTVRYAGSPIPLALAEASYRHSVSVVEVGAVGAAVEEVRVPRTVEVVRLVAPAATTNGAPGASEALELDEVLATLAALPSAESAPRPRHPWLEIRVRLGDRRAPALRAAIEEALRGRAARLVRLAIETDAPSPAAPESFAELGELAPREVVRRRYEALRGGPMSSAHEQALEAVLARACAEVDEARAAAEDAAVQRGSLA
jgi:exonuclease SbcD